MRRITAWCLSAALLLGGLSGCGTARQSTAQTQAAVSWSDMQPTDSMDLEYAESFSVDHYDGGYSLITVKDDARYLVVPETASVPDGLDADITVLQQPLDSIYLVSSSVMDQFVALDALDSISLSGTRQDGWYIDEAKQAMADGKIVYAGKYSAPDYETIYSADCNLAIENTMIYHTPEVKEQLEKLGIPVFVERSSYEPHALGRMEWIKVYGTLLGCEDKAEKLFADKVDGIVDIDCIELVNNTSLYDGTSEISATPVNSKATAKTQQLYQFLQQNYGSKIITGQYASDSSGKELDEIYNITGKYPLIRFADMNAYSPNGGDSQNATAVADSLAWAKDGGVVGLSWLWNAPMGTGTIYEKDTSYDLKTAVTDEDIAGKSLEELSAMVTEGKISQNCYALVSDIDSISEALQPLADADVPVLWRPLPEAGGGWYWWGADGAETYQWLWNLMYTRMTEYHHLNNLLWVWNGQSSSFLVDSSQYDIASLDLYVEKEETYGSRYEQYVALRNMVSSGKLLAISECSNLPDMNAMFRDNAVWSFFGLWYAPYLGEYTDNNALVEFYNSEAALTREDYTPAG